MSNPSRHNTRSNKQQNEEDAEAGSVLSSVKVPPPIDTLVLLTQALTSLLVTTEERRKEEKERREFEDARLRQWKSTEKDRQARFEYLETANAGREAAAREARAMVAETREAQRQADLSSRKKQSILQPLPKLDDQTDPEAFLATFEAAMKEGNFQNNEWTMNIRKLLTGKASSIYQEMNVTTETPYLVFKTSLLQRHGYTETRTRNTFWRSSPGNQQSPRNHLTPILKGITRLDQNIRTTLWSSSWAL